MKKESNTENLQWVIWSSFRLVPILAFILLVGFITHRIFYGDFSAPLQNRIILFSTIVPYCFWAIYSALKRSYFELSKICSIAIFVISLVYFCVTGQIEGLLKMLTRFLGLEQ
ncbi:hypothetical protein AV654_19785 [Paenibacillus elgii]|uniref:Uncharacterized protein n=1 Tax=Paenibacillus elgii TaxID=189691 RepID=A0A163XPB2_9BACL|nr:hypothetical protein AV654_19785 [Paenibacillus elgii]